MAAESRGIPLRAILTAAAVVVLVYVAAKVFYHLRDVILLMVVAIFLITAPAWRTWFNRN